MTTPFCSAPSQEIKIAVGHRSTCVFRFLRVSCMEMRDATAPYF